MATWQVLIVAAAALAFVGTAVVTVARMQFRRASSRAVARPGSALESGRFGAEVAPDARVFDGFSYRLTARFAGRARVVTYGPTLVYCAPRGPAGLYWFWIWLQTLTLWAAPVLLVWALVAFDWRLGLAALATLVASTLVMALGAGIWPGLGEVPGLTDGHFPAIELALADVGEVTLGKGWADGGMRAVIFPYVPGIDRLAEGHAVAWSAPDERGRLVRYALHCYEQADAEELAATLSAGS